MVLEKKPLFITQIGEKELSFLPPFIEKEGFLSLFAIPLVAKGKIQGTLVAFHRLSFNPPPDWTTFLITIGGN